MRANESKPIVIDTKPGSVKPEDGDVKPHDSDCALHNAPAYPAGPCDCMAGDGGVVNRA